MQEKQKHTTSFLFTLMMDVCLRDSSEEILLQLLCSSCETGNRETSFIAFDAWGAGPSSEWLQDDFNPCLIVKTKKQVSVFTVCVAMCTEEKENQPTKQTD